MADESRIYLAIVDGEKALYRHTDPRLVRKHIIEQMTPPKIEVRIPSTEEAMDAALDGLTIKDLTAPTEEEKEKLAAMAKLLDSAGSQPGGEGSD